MIDNFELIYEHILFRQKQLLEIDNFYFFMIQLIKRRKDHPDLKKDNKTITVYRIDSATMLKEVEKEIKAICEATGARAMINLNPCNRSTATKKFFLELADIVVGDQKGKDVMSLSISVCARNPIRRGLTWLVDVDNGKTAEGIEEFVLLEVPTPNGKHLITKPFNREKYKIDCEIHKNNPTLLYMPNFKQNDFVLPNTYVVGDKIKIPEERWQMPDEIK